MSKTAGTLLVKFLATLVAAWVAFGTRLNNPLNWILLVALAGTILNYIAGDLVVLPTLGNVVAAFGDGVLAALTAYAVNRLTPAFDTTWGSLVLFGVLVTVFEYFFHGYLLRAGQVAP